MDWLASLQAFGTSFLYPTLKLLLKLCYIVTIPLHYPIYYLLYYLLTLILFLFSPIWYMLRSISSSVLAVVGLVAKLKYIYIYLACAAVIGILAGCVLRGTSSFIFVTLGIDASQKQNLDHQSHQQIFDEEEDFGVTESGTRSESSGRLSSRRTKSKQEPRDDAYDMFERQWKLQRSSEKPKRRRRGLLSQTIHEESSSDFS